MHHRHSSLAWTMFSAINCVDMCWSSLTLYSYTVGLGGAPAAFEGGHVHLGGAC